MSTPQSFPPEMDQACVIPFRWAGEVLEICLITSLKKKKWIFPKGIVDPGETVGQSGLKEAWEEAGLKGAVGPVVDHYTDQKWGSQLNVNVMLMNVTEACDEWPEKEIRQRVWLSVAKARERLSRAKHRKLLHHLEQLKES